MIWLRRALAVFLAILFVVVFVVSILLFRVNDTALNPGFYTGQLRDAEAYTYVHDTVLPAAVDEAFKDNKASSDVMRLKADALKVAQQTVPADWLQAQVEQVIKAALPYMVGSTDTFSVTIPIADRVDVAAAAMKATLKDSASLDALYNDLTDRAAKYILDNPEKLPLGLSPTRDDLVVAIRSVVTKDWLRTQIERAIDQLVPYLKGDAQHFSVTVPLADRADAMARAVKDLAAKGDTYSYVYDEVIKTAVNQTVGYTTNLPYGVTVTRAEVEGVIKQALPRSWAEQRFNDVLDTAVAYVTGRRNDLTVTIPLADRQEAAYQAIAALADKKLETMVSGLPTCSLEEFTARLQGLPSGQLPTCRPAGIAYAQMKLLLRLDYVSVVKQQMKDQIPASWTFTQADLQKTMGPDAWSALQDARKYVVQGYTFSDADLFKEMNAEDRKTIDDLRGKVKGGITFTQADFRKQLEDPQNGNDGLRTLDEARRSLHTARTWMWVLWPVMGLMLAGIGFLGGRNWGSRLAWAGAVLFIAALVTFIAAGPVFNATARPAINEAFDDMVAEADPGVARVTMVKVSEVGKSATASFAGGVRNRGVLFMVIGGLLLGGGIALQVVRPPWVKPPVQQAANPPEEKVAAP